VRNFSHRSFYAVNDALMNTIIIAVSTRFHSIDRTIENYFPALIAVYYKILHALLFVFINLLRLLQQHYVLIRIETAFFPI